MNESDATTAVHNKLPKTRMLIWKIIDQYTNGIPDAYYGGEGGLSLWVEYKITKRKTPPARIDITPKKNASSRLSGKQQKWLNDHLARGHNVAAVVMHYRPRNTQYYIMRHGQWNSEQSTDDLLHFDKQQYLDWIMSETGISGLDNNEQADAQ